MRLGLQGTYAGVGDLVQARRNGWELAGHAGNRRGPINREAYRVTAVRDDGGLEVTTLAGRGRGGVGERIVLPPAHVGEHLALGYATTVHAAQGITVDTSHSVLTPGTGAASLYVGLTRGRDENTAHVATVTGADDAAQGGEDHRLHRDPVAVLAGILDAPESAATMSALAVATESIDDATSVRTAGELLADAAQLAATERTATWLDQLTDSGVLSASQRARIAAEDGAANLTRILRRAELAGHDPAPRAASTAVADRPLDGARNLSNVIYSRIRDAHAFDPVGRHGPSGCPARTTRSGTATWPRSPPPPTSAPPARPRHRHRAARVGGRGLRPRPGRCGAARTEWEQRAGLVAAYRELRGHDDPTEALGPAPQPGQVEAYAAFRAAWRDSGPPRGRARGARIVRRAAARCGSAHTSARRPGRPATSATNSPAPTRPPPTTARPRPCAPPKPPPPPTPTSGHGSTPRPRRPPRWPRSSTSGPRSCTPSTTPARTGSPTPRPPARPPTAPRPNSPPATPTTPPPSSTTSAQEWLDAHRAALAEDERHRDITDADVSDRPRRPASGAARDDRSSAYRAVPRTPRTGQPARPGIGSRRGRGPDLREIAAAEPAQRAEDVVRVPTADQTADAIDRANRALAEIGARDILDAHEAAEHRTAQLARWHADDQLTARARPRGRAGRARARPRQPTLMPSRPSGQPPSERRCGAGSGSGGGPLRRHAQRNVARTPSHHPGRSTSRSGQRTSSCSAARYSASISSSYALAVRPVTGDRARNGRPTSGRTTAAANHRQVTATAAGYQSSSRPAHPAPRSAAPRPPTPPRTPEAAHADSPAGSPPDPQP